ncbi:MAG: glycerate kinase [Phycisphaerales bacterium]
MGQPRQHISAIIAAAVSAADPRRALALAARRDKPESLLQAPVLAVGKAASAMLTGWITDLYARPPRAVVIHPPADPGLPISAIPSVTIIESDHPLPTERSVAAGRAALEFAQRCSLESRPLVVLLSGGASSLMVLPHAGLTVADIAACTRDLLLAGASIRQINTVRTRCDRVKAGGIALAAAPSHVRTYILSDVIGDHLPSIGSGPTVMPDTSPLEALDTLREFGLDRRHAAIAAHLRLLASRSGVDAQHTAADFAHTRASVIANNAIAVCAAAEEARSLGYAVASASSDVTGESRDAVFDFVSQLRRARARSAGHPVAIIWGGETTVTVRGSGVGGRNQEAALAAAIAIDNDRSLTVATFATDGIDGPTDAAGAVVSGHTAGDARRAGVDPEDALRSNDSHGFFSKVGGLLKPGPTGTNVNDLWVGLAN